MNKNLKALSLCLASTLFLTTCVHADYPDYQEYYPDQYPCETTQSGGNGCIKNVCNFINEWGISLDSLWWKAEEEGIELGREIFISRDGFNPATGIYADVIEDTKVKDLKFQYDTGFRFNISHALPQYCCDVKFGWTHFETKAKAHGQSCIHPEEPDYHSYVAFLPYWETIARNFPNAAKGKWNLYIDLFDLDVGHKYGISTCFHLRPHFGLRVARVDQKFRMKSFSEKDPAFDFNGTSYKYDSITKAKCDFIGVGPRLGCDVEFNMCWGFSLFGKAAGTLAYGNAERSAHEHLCNADDFYLKFDEFDSHTKNQKDEWVSRAITDLAIGLKWENKCRLGSWKFPVMIAILWEHHAFYDFNNFDVDSGLFTNDNHDAFDFGPYANILPSPKKHGDLFTQGLTVSTRIGF